MIIVHSFALQLVNRNKASSPSTLLLLFVPPRQYTRTLPDYETATAGRRSGRANQIIGNMYFSGWSSISIWRISIFVTLTLTLKVLKNIFFKKRDIQNELLYSYTLTYVLALKKKHLQHTSIPCARIQIFLPLQSPPRSVLAPCPVAQHPCIVGAGPNARLRGDGDALSACGTSKRGGRLQVARRIQGRCQVSVIQGTSASRPSSSWQWQPNGTGSPSAAVGRGKRPKPPRSAHRTAPNCRHVPCWAI